MGRYARNSIGQYAPVGAAADDLPGGATPTGKKTIDTTAEVDVASYATAQVVDENLTAANIKKDVEVLGITGEYEGGGGGGSSDFSEATITFNFTIPEGYGIEQVYGENFKFKYGIREHPDIPGVFRASDLINPYPAVMEITVPLYKGEATVEMFAPVCSVPGYDLIIDYETLVLSGGISFDEDDSVYVITGDGTFTATCTVEPL